VTLLSVERLSFAYEGSDGAFALKGVDVDVDEGGLLAVLGPNGSGKSTLLRLICRALLPAAGRVALDGGDTRSMRPAEVAQCVALVPQELSAVFAVTVEQMVSLGRFPRNRWFGWVDDGGGRAVEEALRLTDLWSLRGRLVSHLSGGERRRVLLARALAQEPRLLLLDEPTAHLDPPHQVDFLRLVESLRRERRLAVAAVLHDVNLAMAWCPRWLVLKEGAPLFLGPAEEALASGVLERAYGLRPRLVADADGRRHVDFFHEIASGGHAP
jgi:iron complex transport system ATP-binding protein